MAWPASHARSSSSPDTYSWRLRPSSRLRTEPNPAPDVACAKGAQRPRVQGPAEPEPVAALSKQLDGFVERADGTVVTPPEVQQVADRPLAAADAGLVCQLAVDGQGLLEQPLAHRQLAPVHHSRKAGVVERIGQLAPVIAGASQREAFFVEDL